MRCVIYTKNNLNVSISTQFQECRKYAFEKGLKVAYHIDDINGNRFNEAVNHLLANSDITTLIVYNKYIAFDDMDEYKFYCVYFVKLNKQLLTINKGAIL